MKRPRACLERVVRAGRGLRENASVLHCQNAELRKVAEELLDASMQLLEKSKTARAGASLALLEGWRRRTSS